MSKNSLSLAEEKYSFEKLSSNFIDLLLEKDTLKNEFKENNIYC